MQAQLRVTLHVIHLAVVMVGEPAFQVRAILFEIHIRDRHLREAQLQPPELDVGRELMERGRHSLHRICAAASSVESSLQKQKRKRVLFGAFS